MVEDTCFYKEIDCKALCCRLLILVNKDDILRLLSEIPNIYLYVTSLPISDYVMNRNKDGYCIFYKDNECSIHDIKPQVCNLFMCKKTIEYSKVISES